MILIIVCNSKPTYSIKTVKRVIGVDKLREVLEFGSHAAVHTFMDAKGLIAPADYNEESLRWYTILNYCY